MRDMRPWTAEPLTLSYAAPNLHGDVTDTAKLMEALNSEELNANAMTVQRMGSTAMGAPRDSVVLGAPGPLRANPPMVIPLPPVLTLTVG